ncbi:MAG: hypothetical protein J2P28_21345 [Actinobacteria bacterium]|nr:hypothetical protein [Actinomycetota bacterium]
MSNDHDLTPEQHLQAAFDHIASAARKFANQTWQALEPLITRLGELTSDAELQALLRRRAEEDLASACECRCADIHPGSWVCDVKAVTTVRRSDPAGPADVPVCAPCAAEMMAQQLSP